MMSVTLETLFSPPRSRVNPRDRKEEVPPKTKWTRKENTIDTLFTYIYLNNNSGLQLFRNVYFQLISYATELMQYTFSQVLTRRLKKLTNTSRNVSSWSINLIISNTSADFSSFRHGVLHTRFQLFVHVTNRHI